LTKLHNTSARVNLDEIFEEFVYLFVSSFDLYSFLLYSSF
jgi:hypothetical protein